MRKFSCPDEYYTNCRNAIKLCKVCKVTNPRARNIEYAPIITEGELATHPKEGRTSQGRKIQKDAAYTERQLEKRIAKTTLRSGAALGDGDLCLLEEMRVEVKRRGARKSWNLTWEEYCKGKRQRIDAYAIDIETPTGQRETIYMLDEATFTQILSQLNISYNTHE